MGWGPAVIYYLYKAPYRYTVEKYFLSEWARPLRNRIRMISYQRLRRKKHFHPGTYIFADVERLSVAEQECAAVVYNALDRHPARFKLINHPILSLKRYPLLRKLHELGVNTFDVYRLSEQRTPKRFPVFLRDENDHKGALTELLSTKEELDLTVRNLVNDGRSLENKLIVEYVDTRQPDGRYMKFGVYRIGDQIIPQHSLVGDQWHVKFSSRAEPSRDDIDSEISYLRENPFRVDIMKIFEIAHIEYGRIDFGIKDHRIQVFEINSNPHIMTRPVDPTAWRFELNRLFTDKLKEAFGAIDLECRERGSLKVARNQTTRAHRLGRLVQKLPYRCARRLGLDRSSRRRWRAPSSAVRRLLGKRARQEEP